jgi:serine/threonine protein kinase
MDTKHIKYYRPDCVIAPCGIGSSCYIGHLDESTVLKYPLVDDEATRALLVAEAYMYQVLGSHPRILQCFGLGKHGLQLEYAPKGTLKEFLASASRSFRGKITWWRQTVEAIAHAHTKNIIHCNISTANLLLDNDLNIKLCDFQGRALDPLTRVVIQSGDALEASKSYLPRPLGQDDERSGNRYFLNPFPC